MPSRASKPKSKPADRDSRAVARRVVEQAIGERLDGSPLPAGTAGHAEPGAMALSKMGASKGGKARAENLSARKRKDIARAAKALESLEQFRRNFWG